MATKMPMHTKAGLHKTLRLFKILKDNAMRIIVYFLQNDLLCKTED